MVCTVAATLASNDLADLGAADHVRTAAPCRMTLSVAAAAAAGRVT